eukprot:gene262-8703_t
MTPSCQTCGKQFEPEDGADPDRLPLVFDCIFAPRRSQRCSRLCRTSMRQLR